jgi:hypothetical protein
MIVPPVRYVRVHPFAFALSLAMLLAVQIWALQVKDAARFAVIVGLVVGLVLSSIGSFLRSRTTAAATQRVGLVLLLAGIAILVVAIVVDISAARSFNAIALTSDGWWTET